MEHQYVLILWPRGQGRLTAGAHYIPSFPRRVLNEWSICKSPDVRRGWKVATLVAQEGALPLMVWKASRQGSNKVSGTYDGWDEEKASGVAWRGMEWSVSQAVSNSQGRGARQELVVMRWYKMFFEGKAMV